jgi:hypothetical protein
MAMKHAKSGYFVARDEWQYVSDRYVYFEQGQLLKSLDKTHAAIYKPTTDDLHAIDWYILAKVSTKREKELRRVLLMWTEAVMTAKLDYLFPDEIAETNNVLYPKAEND